MTTYRSFCLACDHTTLAEADAKEIPSAPPGVYRAKNGALCLKCHECGETKHAVPHSS